MTTNTTIDFNLVWGRSATDVYAIATGGLLFHFDGASWTQMTLPPNTVVIDIWGAPNDLFITTTRGLLRFDGTQWSPIATGTLFLTANVTGVGNSVVFSDVRGGVHQLLRFEPW